MTQHACHLESNVVLKIQISLVQVKKTKKQKTAGPMSRGCCTILCLVAVEPLNMNEGLTVDVITGFSK